MLCHLWVCSHLLCTWEVPYRGTASHWQGLPQNMWQVEIILHMPTWQSCVHFVFRAVQAQGHQHGVFYLMWMFLKKLQRYLQKFTLWKVWVKSGPSVIKGDLTLNILLCMKLMIWKYFQSTEPCISCTVHRGKGTLFLCFCLYLSI